MDQKPRVLPAAAIRGGNWDNGTNAGVFAFNVNNAPSNWNNNIGFRCCSSNISLSEQGVLARIFYLKW